MASAEHLHTLQGSTAKNQPGNNELRKGEIGRAARIRDSAHFRARKRLILVGAK
jgi:hypothetical protein